MIWLILSTLKTGLQTAATVLHKPGIRCNDDAELVKLAQDLLNQLKEQLGDMSAINQTVTAKYAATSGTGNATVSQINDNAPSEDRKK